MEPDDDEQPFVPPTRGETLVPAAAVAAVAIAAVTAAVMGRHMDNTAAQQPVAQQAAAPIVAANVVHAPPLAAPATNAMGGAPACARCGIVQMVVAVYDRGHKQPRGYQMHVRMDDGSVRTVEQRGALAAGSRVTVDGSTVRPLS